MISNIINLIYQITGGAQAENEIKNLKDKLEMAKAWAAYWIIKDGIDQAVYMKNSLGRNTTYCNVSSLDILDRRSKGIWAVKVQIGPKYKKDFEMGNEILGFDFDIKPILKNKSLSQILNTTIPKLYANALEAEKRGDIKLLSPSEAQKLANKGIPSIIIHPGLGPEKIGHVAVVAPHFIYNKKDQEWILLPYDKENGMYTGNAGWTNDMMYEFDKRGFGAYKKEYLEERKIYQFKNYKTGKFDE